MLKNLCDLLLEHDIEIRALTVANSAEYALLLLLVDKPDDCIDILDKNSYSNSAEMVLAVKLKSDHNTQGLQEIAKLLGDNNINIEYIYSTLVKNEALLILRVDDNEKAKEVLKKDGFILEERDSI
jgi:hypothetical protein